MAIRMQVQGPERRLLDVECTGPDGGPAVLYHTGTPSAGMMFGPLVAAGADRGMRHVTYSRPGYGHSDRQEGRSIADCVHDVTAIVDSLGIERFFTVGWSGGGPHALACAALLPERTIAAATVAGVAPHAAQDLDWSAGMASENLDEFAAAEIGGARLQQYLEPIAAELRGVSGPELHAVLGDLVSEVDRGVLSTEFADHLCAWNREGLAVGVWGWFDDDVAFVNDWGFELESIERPVTVWAGRARSVRAVQPRTVARPARARRKARPARRARPPVDRCRRLRGDPRRTAPR